MKFLEFAKKCVRDYFMIFAVIVICLTLLRQIFQPDSVLTLKDIYILMICALAGDLPGFILYSPRALSEKEMRVRLILHFVAIEAVIILFAYTTGLVNGLGNVVALAVEIAVIYFIVRVLVWLDDRKVTQSINERLKVMKTDSGDPTKEQE